MVEIIEDKIMENNQSTKSIIEDEEVLNMDNVIFWVKIREDNTRVLQLITNEFEPVATLSIDPPASKLNEDEFLIKPYGENARIVSFLIANKYLIRTGKYIMENNRIYPVCKLNIKQEIIPLMD
ncbi:MAG: hypothetical protein ACTSU2_13460 [Promethearchaeota archaeon]